MVGVLLLAQASQSSIHAIWNIKIRFTPPEGVLFGSSPTRHDILIRYNLLEKEWREDRTAAFVWWPQPCSPRRKAGVWMIMGSHDGGLYYYNNSL
jgi:hypothetical protein